MKRPATWMWIMLGLLLAGGTAAQAALTIRHTPITRAVPDQPLTLKAVIAGGEGAVANATLHVALFRDAAPFRVPMNATGMDVFVGTIRADLVRGANSFSYFISAEDARGNYAETDWQDVTFQAPAPRQPPAATPPPVVQPTGSGTAGAPPAAPPRSANRNEGMSAATVGIIAGGAAAIGIGAYLVSDSGGGDGGGSSNDGEPDEAAAGTYNGTVNICLTPDGSPSECEARPAAILIDANGQVFSDTVQPGQSLSAGLSGNAFTLQASVNDPASGTTGTILYSGDVVGNRIVGTISGTADINGVSGIYSGSFSLSR